MSASKITYNCNPGENNECGQRSAGTGRDVLISLAVGVAVFGLYLLLNGSVFSVPSIRQMVLKKQNARLMEKIEYIGQRTAIQSERLAELEMRDNKVYRPIFGMDELPPEVRSAGYGSESRYDVFQEFPNARLLTESARSQDVMEMRAYLQSLSYDEIEKVAMKIEDMNKFIPSLMPVCPGRDITITSPFGYRLHPIEGYVIFHSGTDIAGPRGTPVYAAADGVVSEVKFNFHGYGNVVDIDHGFGYATRYGHLQSANVERGQKIHRGDQIGTMGSTGRATGPHLHYEVLYNTLQVNPWNYFDKNISPKEYMTLVTPADKLND
ncbi:MAG: M23 family metallopeptidase [Bacteroidales bacterium]|nr:M23 family metallopeptidase [Bacteroidales bacterium]